jgi:hypothetical protein
MEAFLVPSYDPTTPVCQFDDNDSLHGEIEPVEPPMMESISSLRVLRSLRALRD